MNNITIVILLIVMVTLICAMLYSSNVKSMKAKNQRFVVYSYMLSYMNGVSDSITVLLQNPNIGLCLALKSYRDHVDSTVSADLNDYPELVAWKNKYPKLLYKNKPYVNDNYPFWWWPSNDVDCRIAILNEILRNK